MPPLILNKQNNKRQLRKYTFTILFTHNCEVGYLLLYMPNERPVTFMSVDTRFDQKKRVEY